MLSLKVLLNRPKHIIWCIKRVSFIDSINQCHKETSTGNEEARPFL